jgi:hypothetical protein
MHQPPIGIPDGEYDKMLTMARANILYFIADDCFESTTEAHILALLLLFILADIWRSGSQEKHTFIKEIKNIFKGHTVWFF